MTFVWSSGPIASDIVPVVPRFSRRAAVRIESELLGGFSHLLPIEDERTEVDLSPCQSNSGELKAGLSVTLDANPTPS